MKKIWVYISTFLTGVIAGLVAMYYMMGDQISIEVRKIKNKKTSGANSVTIPIEVKKREKRAKKARRKNKLK